MKKTLFASIFLFGSFVSFGQNPGLVISEILVNPAGTDSPFEWVELVATQSIDFSVTPYSVVVNNNGTATANGWVNGGTVTYGFNITTGTVVAGDVVYVGGSTLAPSGTKLRVINTGTTAGDGFGTAAPGGVFGNGGANADGVAVFNLPVASLTNSSVPVDALFFGTGTGTAVVSGGTAGYQLPVNDRYSGGKLQTTSFLAGDPASDISIRGTGFFNTATNTWFGQRSWTNQAPTNDNTTFITFGITNPPGTASIATVTQTISESAGTATVNVTFANPNTDPAKIVVSLSTYTNATAGSDFTFVSDTVYIPANSAGTFPFVINITDDVLAERAERIIVKLTGSVNAQIASNNYQIIYLTDNDYVAPTSTNELSMSLLSTYSNGAEGTNSAEIVAYDSTTFRLYIVNSVAAKMDIINFSNPSAPTLINSVSLAAYGNINSLAVYNGIVAAAIENIIPESNGFVLFLDANGVVLNQLTVGAMPDMITYSRDHTKVLLACEGQPKSDYTVDPEGSVAIVDLSPGIAALTNANVSIAGFSGFNAQMATLVSQGVRFNGPGSSVAQDVEPEYITLLDDNQTAIVALQENNAFAVININTATVTEIRSLGLSDFSTGNGMDFSDQTVGVYISSVPVKGYFMPDAIAHATIGGQEYVFSANEGDSREYTANTDVSRLSAASLDATAFPDQAILKNNQFLGRLNILKSSADGDTDLDGDIDEIRTQGTRSFSIWNPTTGALVFDSKDLLEQLTSNHPTLSGLFNASNTSGAVTMKNRSDDKGPEPEGVSTAFINGNHYLFVSLERIGGVMIFNVDQPTAPVYSGYFNNRSVATNGPDRGAEGIIHIGRSASPNGNDLVILANEISSTLTVYQVNTCVEQAGAIISVPTDTICQGNTVSLSIPGNAQSTIQWLRNDLPLPGETANTLVVSQAGDYRVYISNSTLACADTTIAYPITVNPLPVVGAGNDVTICRNQSVSVQGSGAVNYSWSNGIFNATLFTPTATNTYTVTGTGANGCSNTDQVTIAVNQLPIVTAGGNQTVCVGTSVTLTATGAAQYVWDNSISNGVAFQPTVGSINYTVVGTDVNGCSNDTVVNVTVNGLPDVNAGADTSICRNSTFTFQATGASSYVWSNGIANGVAFTPQNTGSYSVVGTDANGCQNTDQLLVEINELPTVTAGNNQTVCFGEAAVLNGSGATTYVWSNGIQNGVSFIPSLGNTTFTVTGTDANGCVDGSTVAVQVNPLPNVILGADTTICSNQVPFVLDAGSGFTSYQWNNNSSNQTTTANVSGTYSVTVTNAFGCENEDALTLTVENCLGLSENELQLTVAPNPTSGWITLSSSITEPMRIRVRALSGQNLLTTTIENGTGTIDLSSLAAGVVMIEVQQGTRTTLVRLVKID